MTENTLVAEDNNATKQLSFENTKYAFAYKSIKDLKLAKFLFKTMGSPFILNLGLKLMPSAIKYKLPFARAIMKKTIFKQFVGGETLQETATVAEKLGKYDVQVILDYGVEGGEDSEAEYDHAMNEFIKVISYASSQPNVPLMSIKVTGITRFGLLEKIDSLMHAGAGTLMKRYGQAISQLTESEKNEWQNAERRVLEICRVAKEGKVGVLVDAEETWIQDAVDALTMIMMDANNKEEVSIYNTIQLYRHDRLQFLKDCYEAAESRGFILGAKLVRGAYMEKERLRAVEKGYPSPIQPSKEATDRDYDDAIRFCMERLDKVALIVASHNEDSNKLAAQLLGEKAAANNYVHVHFSQLYGMSDNITFNLAEHGYNVSKYLPFGPIDDVVPYLMRRAQENSSVEGQTSRELGLIEKEIKRRKHST